MIILPCRKTEGEGGLRKGQYRIMCAALLWHQEKNILYFSEHDLKMCLYQCCSFSVTTGICDYADKMYSL